LPQLNQLRILSNKIAIGWITNWPLQLQIDNNSNPSQRQPQIKLFYNLFTMGIERAFPVATAFRSAQFLALVFIISENKIQPYPIIDSIRTKGRFFKKSQSYG